MVQCTFCKDQIKPGRGVTFVEISGKIHHFCGSKCKKNLLHLKRDPKKVKWVVKKKK